MNEYTFTLSVDHINTIITALGELPLKTSNSAFQSLRIQMQKQDAQVKKNDTSSEEVDSD